MIKNKINKNLPEISTNVFGIDTHCHLDMDAYSSDLQEVILNAESNSIKYIITIGIDLESSERAIEIASKNKSVYATIGIHPHNADLVTDDTFNKLRLLAKHPKVVAYGEIGLDYAKQYSSPDSQMMLFRKQLTLANELNLPVIIHDREAHDDTISALREIQESYNGIMHCFSGDLNFAQQVIKLGLYISIPGIVTFKNALDLQRVAQEIPLEYMLLETDSPFLAPVPWRGKRNEPVNILYTAEKIAELRNISTEEVLAKTSENAVRFFGLGHQ